MGRLGEVSHVSWTLFRTKECSGHTLDKSAWINGHLLNIDCYVLLIPTWNLQSSANGMVAFSLPGCPLVWMVHFHRLTKTLALFSLVAESFSPAFRIGEFSQGISSAHLRKDAHGCPETTCSRRTGHLPNWVLLIQFHTLHGACKTLGEDARAQGCK